MKNFVQPGHRLTFIAPVGGVVSGGAYLFGVTLAVAVTSAAAGAEFEGQIEGVVEIDKATGVAGAVGALAYWDDTAKKITTSASGNTAVGIFAAPNVSADVLVKVKLNG